MIIFPDDASQYVAFFNTRESSDSEYSADDQDDNELENVTEEQDSESVDENLEQDDSESAQNLQQTLFHPKEEVVYSDENIFVKCQKIPFKRQKKFALTGN